MPPKRKAPAEPLSPEPSRRKLRSDGPVIPAESPPEPRTTAWATRRTANAELVVAPKRRGKPPGVRPAEVEEAVQAGPVSKKPPSTKPPPTKPLSTEPPSRTSTRTTTRTTKAKAGLPKPTPKTTRPHAARNVHTEAEDEGEGQTPQPVPPSAPSPITSLSDLVRHIPAQEEAISKLPSSVVESKTDNCTIWNEFRKQLWGKILGSLQRGQPVKRDEVEPIDDIVLPGTHTIATLPEDLPAAWKLPSRQILVRSEYSKAEKAALPVSESVHSVFVVTGQPGIGKSVFLLWLLMRRLALRLPTVLQIQSSYAILFHEHGVSEFMDLENQVLYSSLVFPPSRYSSRIWVLVDSNPQLPEPAGIFKYSSPFFVVDAVSPGSDHLEWLKKNGHEYFYMGPWSISEILQARQFLGHNFTERQLWDFHNKYGASPGTLVLYADKPATYKSVLRREITKMNLSLLRRIFKDPGFHRSSHFITTIEPLPPGRLDFKIKIASQHVLKLLWEEHIQHEIEDMEYFYNQFLDNSITATSAGWIFKLRMHQLLMRQQTIRVFPILGHCRKANIIYNAPREWNNPTDLQLPNSVEHPLVERCHLLNAHYYHPKPTNLHAIDSLLLIHPPGKPSPILLTFQIIQNGVQPNVNVNGLCKINDLDIPPDICRYHVVVTPEGIHPKITAPMKYFRDEEILNEDEDEDEDDGEMLADGDGDEEMPADKVFSVFHFPVPMGELFAH